MIRCARCITGAPTDAHGTGRENAATDPTTAPSSVIRTRNASSPCSGCPASVPYANPASWSLPSSSLSSWLLSRTVTTAHGAGIMIGPTPMDSVTLSPGQTLPTSEEPPPPAATRTPASRCICHERIRSRARLKSSRSRPMIRVSNSTFQGPRRYEAPLASGIDKPRSRAG